MSACKIAGHDCLSGAVTADTPDRPGEAAPLVMPDPSDATEALRAEIQERASSIGLGDGRFGLLSALLSLVLVNHDDGVVARVARATLSDDDLETMLRLAVAAAAAGAPLLPPLSVQLHHLSDGRRVTFWPLANPPVASPADYGDLLARLHSCAVPECAPSRSLALRGENASRSFAQAESTGAPLKLLARLRDMWEDAFAAACAYPRPDEREVLAHGDFHPCNTVCAGERLLFCDLDDLCRAPRETDLADAWLYGRRYWPGGSWQQFLSAYPHPFDREMVRALGAVRELTHTLDTANIWARMPEARPEFRLRMRTLTTDTALRWTDM